MSSRSSRTRFWKRSSKTGRVIQSRASEGACSPCSSFTVPTLPHDPKNVRSVCTTASLTAGIVCLKKGNRVGASTDNGRERSGSDSIAITVGRDTRVPAELYVRPKRIYMQGYAPSRSITAPTLDPRSSFISCNDIHRTSNTPGTASGSLATISAAIGTRHDAATDRTSSSLSPSLH
jgi:hypothetical protein